MTQDLISGVLVIDKPAGPTSHDIVTIVKRLIGARKVGHLGTLDPAASGVLPLAINDATKRAAELAGIEKVYDFTLILGFSTETDDDTGEVIKESKVPADVLERIEAVLPKFTGRIMQRPPNYSAVKVEGRRAYQLARRGAKFELPPRPVDIHAIEIVGASLPEVRIRLSCRSGTYVRSLCRDLGEEIGCGGHASGIRRLRSGPYKIEDALGLEVLREDRSVWKKYLMPVTAA